MLERDRRGCAGRRASVRPRHRSEGPRRRPLRGRDERALVGRARAQRRLRGGGHPAGDPAPRPRSSGRRARSPSSSPARPPPARSRSRSRSSARAARVTFLSARMEQDGELQATALAVLADDLDASGFAELRDARGRAAGGAVLARPRAGPRHADDVPELQRAARPGRRRLLRRRPLQRRLDARPRAPPARRAAGRGDPRRLVPGSLRRGSSEPVPAPTIDYTVHFRAPLPEPGASAEDPYLATFRSGLARGGFFEEDGELWSADGACSPSRASWRCCRAPSTEFSPRTSSPATPSQTRSGTAPESRQRRRRRSRRGCSCRRR